MEPNKLFVYGILKRGFELDLRRTGRCKFIGEAHIPGAILLDFHGGTGLRFVKDPLKVVHGELFEVTNEGVWVWLDFIEANEVNYRRRVVDVVADSQDGWEGVLPAWVYEHIYYERYAGEIGDGYQDFKVIEGGKFNG